MARKEKKYHFIYKTTNVLSGKYYIGMHSTNDLDDGYLGSGNRIRLAIRKHGKENFKREILEFCESKLILRSREEEIVNLDELAKEKCMNLKVGGEGGWSKEANKAYLERLHNDSEFKERLTKIAIKNNLRLISEGKLKTGKDLYDWTGKKHSDETKKKISESNKGKTRGNGETNSQFGTCWITNEKINKKIKRGDFIPKGFRLGRITKK
jgi:hypothetical protein